MRLKHPDAQSVHAELENKQAKDFLWLNIKDLPYFRGLLRAVEAQFYQQLDLSGPTLDIGCGEGHFAELTFDRQIEVGLDASYPSLHEAAGRHVYRLLTEADGGRMPYPNGYFTSAFSNSVLEHIPAIDQVLQETARVLKPGAMFVFCVPNDRFNEQLSITRALEKLHLWGLAKKYRAFFTYIARHRHLDDPEVWTDRLEAAGFVVEKWWHYFPPVWIVIVTWFTPLDPENYRVLAFNTDGTSRATFGQYGSDAMSFMLPTGIAVGSDGKLYVADGDGHRIMVFPTVP